MTFQPVWVSCQQCPAGQPCKQAQPAQCLTGLARLAGRLARPASHAGWDGGPNRLAGPLRLPGQPARLGSQLAWLGSSKSYRSLRKNIETVLYRKCHVGSCFAPVVLGPDLGQRNWGTTARRRGGHIGKNLATTGATWRTTEEQMEDD